mmetsp:Transcript_105762/g.268725  ORF Transcript_105762/g.268725 Transcript_105762/m.268725 type:complete len:440 (-) Transcript_105762:34-1353(-)
MSVDDVANTDASCSKDESTKKRAVLAGCCFTFVYCIGLTLTTPFAQARRDELGCDALCVGTYSSLQSTLRLAGAVVIGRLSDRVGRRPMLWIGILGNLASMGIAVALPTIPGMFLSLVPSALLDQIFSVLRALFTDFFPGKSGAAEAARTDSIGRLGMALGFAMMLGSGLGGRVAGSFAQAQAIGGVFVLLSLPLIGFLPSPTSTQATSSPSSGGSEGLWKLMALPVLKKPGARLLVGLRITMSLAFWLFYAVWTPSLKGRFEFGAAEHGQLMAFIGLVYALSQGVIAKPLIRKCAGDGKQSDPTILLCACLSSLALFRVPALLTTDIRVVYLTYFFIVVALGIVNILISSAAAMLAGGSSETGGLYGVLEACEAVAGMAGPAMGGMLARAETSLGVRHLVLVVVVALYSVNTVAVALRYKRWVLTAADADVGNEKKSD